MEVTGLYAARKKFHGERYGGPGAQPGLEQLRSYRRELEKVLRKARKEQQLISKIILQDIDHTDGQEWERLEHETETVDHEKVLQMFKAVQLGTGDRSDALGCLQKALKNCEAKKSFIRIENSMQVLIGLFTCNLSGLQTAAAQCLYELSLSSDPCITSACSQATTYLLTYLRGQSSKFTELCLYTLGNLAADSEAVRKKMLLQGAVPALMSCIQSPHAAVVQAAGYSVSQLLQAPEAPEKIIPAFLDEGLDQHLLQLLQSYSDLGIETSTELAWCLHCLVCSDIDSVCSRSNEIVMTCSSVLTGLASAVVSGGMSIDGLELLVTPLLRCLGNLLAKEETDHSRERVEHRHLLAAVFVFMQSFLQHHMFVVRECLWVLNNLTAGDPSFCTDILLLNLVPALLHLLVYTGGVNVLVLTVLCNIAEQGPTYCLQLLKSEIIPALSASLKMIELEVVSQSLELLHLLFKHCPEAAKEFITQSGPQVLEMILYHSNEKLRLQAASILETHLRQHSQISPHGCSTSDGL